MPRDIGKFVARYLQMLGWTSIVSMILEPILFGSVHLDFTFLFCFWAAKHLSEHNPITRKWVIGLTGLMLGVLSVALIHASVAGTDNVSVRGFRIENLPLWYVVTGGGLSAIVIAVPFVLLLTARAKREFDGNEQLSEPAPISPPVWSYRGIRLHSEHLFIAWGISLIVGLQFSTSLWLERQQLLSFVGDLEHKEFHLSAVDTKSGVPIEQLGIGLPGKGLDEVDPVVIKVGHRDNAWTLTWVGAKPFHCTVSAPGYQSQTVQLGKTVGPNVLVHLNKSVPANPFAPVSFENDVSTVYYPLRAH